MRFGGAAPAAPPNVSSSVAAQYAGRVPSDSPVVDRGGRGGEPPPGAGAPPRSRVELEPLQAGERPRALLAAVVVAVVLALAVLVSVLTVHNLSRHGGSLPGGLFLVGVLLLLARGMWERRYWAVLSFEALLAFQIIVTSLALVVAETLLAAGLCALSIGLAGWLFWKLVRVMGRIQAVEHAAGADEA